MFEKQERKTKIYANLKNVNLSVSGEKDLNELQKGNVPFIIEREKTLWCNLCGLKSPDPFIPIQSLRTHLVKSHDFNPELPIPIHITPFESDDEYSSYYMKSLTYERIAEHEQGRRKHRSEYEEDRLNDTFSHDTMPNSKTNDWDTIIQLKRFASKQAGCKFNLDILREKHSLDDIDIKILIAFSMRELDIRPYEDEMLIPTFTHDHDFEDPDECFPRPRRYPIYSEETQMALLGLSPQHIQDVTEYKTHLEKLQRLGLIKTVKDISRTTFLLRIQPDVLKLIIGKKEYHRINRIKKSHHRFRDFGEFGLRRKGEISIIYKPTVSLDRVVLNENDMQKVLFFIAQWKNREKMFKSWGFDSTIHYGKGASILLSVPPGVGKTLLAEAIAYELGMKLSFVDYSKLVCCWVGETSKNISDAFKTAKEKKAVLFFDEADAIVSVRSGIRYSLDKEFNKDVNVLLQEIEKFEGVVILTTNLASNLDKALERRIALKIHLNPPDELQRLKIWQKHIPKNAPLENDVSFEELAKKFTFTGGQIKNAVLNAARFAIARGAEKITQADFIKACMLELEGKEAINQSILSCNPTILTYDKGKEVNKKEIDNTYI